MSTQFELSRIHAQGWNTASKLPLEEGLAMNATAIAALNPYANEPELSRWNEGFAAALRK
jgi:hypothetical protein